MDGEPGCLRHGRLSSRCNRFPYMLDPNAIFIKTELFPFVSQLNHWSPFPLGLTIH